MDEYFKPLEEAFSSYIKDPSTINAIKNAFVFAYHAHESQKRASGEPYIIHPVAVAKTLCTYNADPTTIIAALLHDVIEDTKYSYKDILDNFGPQVANLVEGLTKIQKISYNQENKLNNDENEYVSNFQKMLISMSKDIRVIWIKLSDRLNNMNTLKYLPMEKQIRISQETLDIYTPIAHKLGMYHIKAELEDLAFKYLYPEDYFEISKKIKYTKKSREKDIEKMIDDLRTLLKNEKINCEISGRAKNIFSIYNKMKNKGIAFENIYDLQALRIIVGSIMDCYKVVGIVHSKYSPVPSRFKDYIAVPKPNMYQSLHTTVLNDAKIYEIQIRTKEMDEIAEKGIAAHWAYKEGVKVKKNFYEATASKLHWYSDLVKITGEDQKEKNEITTLFDEDVLKANVYVFTPKNQVISLPEGSTPLDFAYRIHTRIGDTFTGAIVNSKIVPIDYQFKTGDVCEIRTSPSAYGPNENWLKVAKTSGARSKIKQFLNNKNRSLLIEQGKSSINDEIKSRKLQLDITDDLIQKRIPQERQIKNTEDLYYLCGKGVYSAQALVNSLIEQEETTTNERLIELINKRNKNQVYHEDVDIIVEGLDYPSVKLAHCCSPIPGDEIVGYITKGVGIAVHRLDCRNCQKLDQNRLINVYWASQVEKKFQVDLKLLVYNRDAILADILNTCIAYDTKVVRVSAKATDISEVYINITVQVSNKSTLDLMISNLEKIKGVYSIERVRH
ncbi:bifunctional (p)ppGpp synthetase/guanosine-3',5'-bis(diphosphate) 3'-pyrophosphohydrolase [bacterium]|nr:bifunctional (p)ppGpp synthetase/guanosine-3',5'-bis(diphosphate) 3'-pyrophosphohydrolase [bacterium]